MLSALPCSYKSLEDIRGLFFKAASSLWSNHLRATSHMQWDTQGSCLEYCARFQELHYQKDRDKREAAQRTATRVIRRLDLLCRKTLQKQNLVCLRDD